jgi:hypothetical protein
MSSSRHLLREIDRLTTSHSAPSPLNHAGDSSEGSEYYAALAHKSSFYRVPSPRRKPPIAKVHVPTTDDEQYAHSVAFGKRLNSEATVAFDHEGITIAETSDSASVRAECATVLEMLLQEL